MENVVQSINVIDREASDTVEVIVIDLDNVLKQYGFIKNKWSTYGSYKTGLVCIDSDVDLYFGKMLICHFSLKYVSYLYSFSDCFVVYRKH